jgi:ABC-2 type transport system permease protein
LQAWQLVAAYMAGAVVRALSAALFYSARTLGEPWSTLTRLDPIYYVVDTARFGFTGFHEAPAGISLAVATLTFAATFAAAAAIVNRGWRLKP